jgi:hypothetical protein
MNFKKLEIFSQITQQTKNNKASYNIESLNDIEKEERWFNLKEVG